MSNPPRPTRIRFWRYAQALAAPLLLWGLVAFLLREPVNNWLEGDDSYDRAALEEWLDECAASGKRCRKWRPAMLNKPISCAG